MKGAIILSKKLILFFLLSALSAALFSCDTKQITVEESSNALSASVTYETPVNPDNN